MKFKEKISMKNVKIIKKSQYLKWNDLKLSMIFQLFFFPKNCQWFFLEIFYIFHEVIKFDLILGK